jgi:hypothetical protein
MTFEGYQEFLQKRQEVRKKFVDIAKDFIRRDSVSVIEVSMAETFVSVTFVDNKIMDDLFNVPQAIKVVIPVDEDEIKTGKMTRQRLVGGIGR